MWLDQFESTNLSQIKADLLDIHLMMFTFVSRDLLHYIPQKNNAIHCKIPKAQRLWVIDADLNCVNVGG